MHSLKAALDFVLHIDKGLNGIIGQYGSLTYLILYAIVFAETGLVITPFLPGDSLLFAAGALSSTTDAKLNLFALYVIFFAATLTGDNVNYFLGKYLGPKLFNNEKSKLLNRAHLERTHTFFEKHGGKTIIMARFVPIVRTFAPFVAGLGAMTYRQFISFSLIGAALWVGICVTAGYLFGQIEFVQKHFSLVVLVVVAISILPAVFEILKHRKSSKVETI